MRNRLNGLRRDIAWDFGMGHFFFNNSRGSRILVYHGICQKDHLKFNTLFLRYKSFEKQLIFYKKYFNIVSLDDFYQQRFSNDRFNLCLTFDDGLANNFKYVLPLLERYEVPATFFITGIRDAGYDILWNDLLSIGHKYGSSRLIFKNEEFVKGNDGKYISSSSGQRLADLLRFTDFNDKEEMVKLLDPYKKKADADYWLQMTQQEIKMLSASKWVTIGSHSYYHNDLAKVAVVSAKEDIAKSKEFLEKIIGKEVNALAFPYGSYNNEIIVEAKNAGFTQLFATEFLFESDRNDPMLRERLTVNPFISSVNQVYANIRGNYR